MSVTGRTVSIKNQVTLECKCVCGKIYFLKAARYNKNNGKSCGCKSSEYISNAITTHGLSRSENGRKHPLYSIWCGIKDRCLNPDSKYFSNYGGRGIKIEFNDFFDFYDWAINNGWVKGLTIDRRKVNGNYSRSNCRWITNAEQQRNKQNTIMVKAFGEMKCISDWAEDNRCVRSYSSLYDAIVVRKMNPEVSITTKKCLKQIKAV